MTDSSAQEYNCLNINALQPPIEGGKQNDFRYSQHLSKLLRRFVRFAVSGDDDISFSDRELLDDVMRYGSLKEIARLRHCCAATISKRMKHALERQEDGLLFHEMLIRVKQERIDNLQRQLEEARATIEQQKQELAEAARQNQLLEIKLSGKQIGLEYSVENARREVIRQANEKRMRRTDLGEAHLCPDHLCDRETKENN